MADRAVALVSGGASGIGAAIAQRLCADNYTTLIADRAADSADALVAQLRDQGMDVRAIALDVGQELQWAALEKEIKGAYGRLDVCVLAAGIGGDSCILDMTLDGWRGVTAVNLDGVMLGVRTAGRLMQGFGAPGSIIAVSSIMASRSAANYSAYSASKAAVVSLVRSAAIELAAYGIRVNAVSPGNIDTPMLRGSIAKIAPDWESGAAAMATRIPLGHVGQPHHIADVVASLVDPRLSYMTGTEIVVDGGLTAQV